jgi:DNA polymerase V
VVAQHRAAPAAADLVTAAVRGIRQIYRPGYELIKAGVMLLDLQPASRHQHELALDEPAPDTGQLMTALDRINDRYGRGTLAMASAGTSRTQMHWGMKQERRTPQYTTCWEELPVARA